MATKFIRQATQQLAPAFNQQAAALQSQIPAIQQLYTLLNQGLAGEQQAGNQAILEDASGRGVLRSTLPVDRQAGLAGQIIQKQGENAALQAKEIGGIQASIGGIRTDQADAIAQLANALQQAFTQSQSVSQQQRQANREYALRKQVADKQYGLSLRAAQGGF